MGRPKGSRNKEKTEQSDERGYRVVVDANNRFFAYPVRGEQGSGIPGAEELEIRLRKRDREEKQEK